MAYWLLKTEPRDYSYADLEAAGSDTWDGVKNQLAIKHLRDMKSGDLAFIYHTGSERSITGVAEITSKAYPDPKSENPKQVLVNLRPLYRLMRPVTLAEIKQNQFFSGWELVRLPRLSVLPVPESHWSSILKLSEETGIDAKSL